MQQPYSLNPSYIAHIKPMTVSILIAVLCILYLSTTVCSKPLTYTLTERQGGGDLFFEDVFATSGLNAAGPTESLKFGGPCVADLDNDGIYDIILNHHNRNFTRIYFGNRDGTFQVFMFPGTNKPFRTRVFDVHGISVARLTAKSRDRLITFAVGGGAGSMLRAPEIYRITQKREMFNATDGAPGGILPSEDIGFGRILSRPRNAVFMDMQLKSNALRKRDGGGPDVLFVNFLVPKNGLSQFAYKNINGIYTPVEDIGDFAMLQRGRVELTDMDGDGVMEVISIQEFRFYRLEGPFFFVEMTNQILQSRARINDLSVTAVVEFDFDNDGDFDLYVCRTNPALVLRRRNVAMGDRFSDLLLLNDGKKRYKDVTRQSLIPTSTDSLGVTAGDFNNDGFVDLLVVLYDEPDMFLMNQGDGTFRRVDDVIPKDPRQVGNNALAVDYDMDGRVDAIVGHGAVMMGGSLGPYLMMKNMMPLTNDNHYLHVVVYNDKIRASTSLHAVVTLVLPRGVRMVRRVGSRGGQEATGTYLDTVHFGLGSVTVINQVRVKWTSKMTQIRKRVKVDRRVIFGKK